MCSMWHHHVQYVTPPCAVCDTTMCSMWHHHVQYVTPRTCLLQHVNNSVPVQTQIKFRSPKNFLSLGSQNPTPDPTAVRFEYHLYSRIMLRTLVGFGRYVHLVSIHWAINPVVKNESSCDGWHFSTHCSVGQAGVRAPAALACTCLSSHWVWEYHTTSALSKQSQRGSIWLIQIAKFKHGSQTLILVTTKYGKVECTYCITTIFWVQENFPFLPNVGSYKYFAILSLQFGLRVSQSWPLLQLLRRYNNCQE